METSVSPDHEVIHRKLSNKRGRQITKPLPQFRDSKAELDFFSNYPEVNFREFHATEGRE